MTASSGAGSKKATVVVQETGTKPKKVPPPPPPRKSSKLPGQAALIVKEATINGQLPKPKSKTSEPHITKPSVSFASSTKDGGDIIKPPKQFSSITELDTKVERKSSVGSLKQFTTPLLESKRDKSSSSSSKSQPEVVGKKISASNLDSEKGAKQLEKDKDIPGEDEEVGHETSRKVIDGKVTNLSDDQRDITLRRESVESFSSSSSLDSQKDLWLRRKDEVSEASSSLTHSAEEDSHRLAAVQTDQSVSSKSDQSTSSTSSLKSGAQEEKETGKKKERPPPPERRSSLTSKTITDDIPEPPPPLVEERKSSSHYKGSIDRLV